MMRIVLLIVFFLVGVILISKFLGPDDLAKCDNGPTGAEQCRTADVIVAVSGGDTTARTAEAVKLFKQGWAPTLVFSGAAEDPNAPSNAAVMRGIALSSGVPAEVIVIDEYSRTTKENARETANILAGHEISSLIVVTSSYHQRRTSLEFKERFETALVRSHPVSQDNHWSLWWWLTPNGWFLALGELVRIALFYIGATR